MTLLHSRSTSYESPIDTARAEQEQAEAARRSLIDTTEQIRIGELKPSRRTLRHLAHEAMFLTETEAIAPLMTSDALAIAHANLRAAHVDTSPDGHVIADLSDKLLEEAHPYRETDPDHRLRADAIQWAINHTTPELSFEAAHEIGWHRLSHAYGFEYQDTTLVAPPEIREPSSTGKFDPFADDDESGPPTTPLY